MLFTSSLRGFLCACAVCAYHSTAARRLTGDGAATHSHAHITAACLARHKIAAAHNKIAAGQGGGEGGEPALRDARFKTHPPRPSPRPAHAPPSPHAGTHSRTPHTHTMRKPHTHTRRPSAITRERYYCGPSANPPQPVDPRSRQLRDGHNTNLGKIKPGAPKKCAVQRLEFTSHNVGFISSHVSLYLVVPIESFSLCVHARDAFMIVEPSCI